LPVHNAEEARVVFLLDEPGALVHLDSPMCASEASSSCASEPDWLAMPTLELPLGWDDSAAELQEPWVQDQHAKSNVHNIDSSSANGRARTSEEWQPAPPETHQASCSAPMQSRPPRVDQDALLRLLAEAYGQMMLARSGRHAAAPSEEEHAGWLRQLRELALSGDGDTVLALFRALRAQHSWARLSDVYSALVRLRESH
jgi:hypothetical protein